MLEFSSTVLPTPSPYLGIDSILAELLQALGSNDMWELFNIVIRLQNRWMAKQLCI